MEISHSSSLSVIPPELFSLLSQNHLSHGGFIVRECATLEEVLDYDRKRNPLIPFIPVLKHKALKALVPQIPNMYPVTLDISPLELSAIATRMREEKQRSDMLESHIAGKSRGAIRFRQGIAAASRTALPLHISGESGTGKTMGARLVHELSGNRKKLVYVNCATLSSPLSDSALFGHTRGAYTSSCSDREGILENADGTTLMLDEIANLPLDVQAKLLDTLDSGTFRPVGSDREKHTSFRLITASHRTLESLVEEKKLREDFYYRISTKSLSIEPLRDHPEDIPEIVKYYEDRKGIATGRLEDCTSLMSRRWRGNVRELLHYLDRLHS